MILLPLTYNDGSEVEPRVLTRIKDKLFGLFGGYSIRGTVTGAYQMADGSRAEDTSLELWVAASSERIDAVRREVSQICGELRQESIYFEVTDSEVEFVAPPPLETQGANDEQAE